MDNRTLGIILVGLGVVMLLAVFAAAFNSYNSYKTQVDFEGNLQQALVTSAGVLLELLVKIAFLGVALAAGAVVLGKGISLLKGCPEGG